MWQSPRPALWALEMSRGDVGVADSSHQQGACVGVLCGRQMLPAAAPALRLRWKRSSASDGAVWAGWSLVKWSIAGMACRDWDGRTMVENRQAYIAHLRNADSLNAREY